MNFRLVCPAAAVALALGSFTVAGATYPSDLPPTTPPRATAAPAPTPQSTAPLPPAPNLATPAPSGSPAPRGRGASPAPSGSPGETPAPPQFTNLDGTWEVELQTHSKTVYAHWNLHQAGTGGADVTGVWDRGGKPPVKVALSGTFDGRLFKFTATQGATQYTFTGYVENY